MIDDSCYIDDEIISEFPVRKHCESSKPKSASVPLGGPNLSAMPEKHPSPKTSYTRADRS